MFRSANFSVELLRGMRMVNEVYRGRNCSSTCNITVKIACKKTTADATREGRVVKKNK